MRIATVINFGYVTFYSHGKPEYRLHKILGKPQ